MCASVPTFVAISPKSEWTLITRRQRVTRPPTPAWANSGLPFSQSARLRYLDSFKTSAVRATVRAAIFASIQGQIRRSE